MQNLPNEVVDVVAGPDGRAWLQFGTTAGRFARANTSYGTAAPTLPEIREDIAAEFTQSSPQVRDCTLCLIEPGGRAWFWVPQHATLLGYNGKTWINYVIPDASESQPACPTRGAARRRPVQHFGRIRVLVRRHRRVYHSDMQMVLKAILQRCGGRHGASDRDNLSSPIYALSTSATPVWLAGARTEKSPQLLLPERADMDLAAKGSGALRGHSWARRAGGRIRQHCLHAEGRTRQRVARTTSFPVSGPPAMPRSRSRCGSADQHGSRSRLT